MAAFVVRLPDVGEGVAEAELVAWHVAVGDVVTPDSTIAEVLTDKATVEIYSPVTGCIATLYGQAGDTLAVGSDFVVIDTNVAAAPATVEGSPSNVNVVGDTNVAAAPATVEVSPASVNAVAPRRDVESEVGAAVAAPAVRERARRMDIDLAVVTGSGPGGRVTHDDLDRLLQVTSSTLNPPSAETTQTPLIGLRRRIAAQMTTSSSRIPHITYVEEIDMSRLEDLRRSLTTLYPDQPRLTALPFVMGALVLALADHRELNATFDDDAQVITTYQAVHIGIATQTPNGLIVPVIRDAHVMDVWQRAAELARVTTGARDGTATRSELSGSTITITSLGALGGLVTTPIINHPEVAIIGINKMQTRPMWDGSSFAPRVMMNLSSSFDHRIVDGWQAATFVQRIKLLLEEPALLFVPPPAHRPPTARLTAADLSRPEPT